MAESIHEGGTPPPQEWWVVGPPRVYRFAPRAQPLFNSVIIRTSTASTSTMRNMSND